MRTDKWASKNLLKFYFHFIIDWARLRVVFKVKFFFVPKWKIKRDFGIWRHHRRLTFIDWWVYVWSYVFTAWITSDIVYNLCNNNPFLFGKFCISQTRHRRDHARMRSSGTVNTCVCHCSLHSSLDRWASCIGKSTPRNCTQTSGRPTIYQRLAVWCAKLVLIV